MTLRNNQNHVAASYRTFITEFLKKKTGWNLDDVIADDYLAAHGLEHATSADIIEGFNAMLQAMKDDWYENTLPRPDRTKMCICCRCGKRGSRLRIDNRPTYCKACLKALDKREEVH